MNTPPPSPLESIAASLGVAVSSLNLIDIEDLALSSQALTALLNVGLALIGPVPADYLISTSVAYATMIKAMDKTEAFWYKDGESLVLAFCLTFSGQVHVVKFVQPMWAVVYTEFH